MTCGELDGLLDRLMDDELTDEERRAMEAHGQSCPACAEAIRETMRMKALFAELPPEEDVPLEAQAKWRGAVRELSRQKRRGRLLRWAASAAAAVVALAGVGLALNGRGSPSNDAKLAKQQIVERAAKESVAADEAIPEAADVQMEAAMNNGAISAVVQTEDAVSAAGASEADAGSGAEYAIMAPAAAAVPEEGFEPSDSAILEADGESAPMCAALSQRAPACELRFAVADVDEACDMICDLAAEYDAYADVQRLEDGGANVYAEVPVDDAQAFLSAVGSIGQAEGDAALPDISEGTTVLLLLTLNAQG